MANKTGHHQHNTLTANMLDNLKRKLYLRRLTRIESEQQRSRRVHNLHTAKYIGLLSHTASEAVFADIMTFKTALGERGIRTSACIFYPNKQIPNSLLMRKDVEVIGNDALNWLNIPKTEPVQAFMAEQFDLLIDLSTEERLPVRWVSSLSKAQCKVGILPYEQNPFDLIVSTNPRKPMGQIVADITNILLELNKTQ